MEEPGHVGGQRRAAAGEQLQSPRPPPADRRSTSRSASRWRRASATGSGRPRSPCRLQRLPTGRPRRRAPVGRRAAPRPGPGCRRGSSRTPAAPPPRSRGAGEEVLGQGVEAAGIGDGPPLRQRQEVPGDPFQGVRRRQEAQVEVQLEALAVGLEHRLDRPTGRCRGSGPRRDAGGAGGVDDGERRGAGCRRPAASARSRLDGVAPASRSARVRVPRHRPGQHHTARGAASSPHRQQLLRPVGVLDEGDAAAAWCRC